MALTCFQRDRPCRDGTEQDRDRTRTKARARSISRSSRLHEDVLREDVLVGGGSGSGGVMDLGVAKMRPNNARSRHHRWHSSASRWTGSEIAETTGNGTASEHNIIDEDQDDHVLPHAAFDAAVAKGIAEARQEDAEELGQLSKKQREEENAGQSKLLDGIVDWSTGSEDDLESDDDNDGTAADISEHQRVPTDALPTPGTVLGYEYFLRSDDVTVIHELHNHYGAKPKITIGKTLPASFHNCEQEMKHFKVTNVETYYNNHKQRREMLITWIPKTSSLTPMPAWRRD